MWIIFGDLTKSYSEFKLLIVFFYFFYFRSKKKNYSHLALFLFCTVQTLSCFYISLNFSLNPQFVVGENTCSVYPQLAVWMEGFSFVVCEWNTSWCNWMAWPHGVFAVISVSAGVTDSDRSYVTCWLQGFTQNSLSLSLSAHTTNCTQNTRYTLLHIWTVCTIYVDVRY